MASNALSPYAQLEARFRKVMHLRDVAGMLQWDMATTMPPGGAASRADQLATLEVVCHETLADAALEDLMGAAEAEEGTVDPWRAANLREMRRLWLHENALPVALVAALARAIAACEMTWREARARDDFKMLRPKLGEVLNLVREAGAAKGEVLGCGVYDALLDSHDSGRTAAEVDRIFGWLEPFLRDFLPTVLEHQKAHPPLTVPAGPFPVAKQNEVATHFMKVLGFEFHNGRLDVSHHPFCGGTPDDVRITTRYDTEDFASSLMAVLHETGHALYQRGLPQVWRDQPVGRMRGMTLHESQSLLIEMQACRSREFIAFAAPLLRQAFGGEGAAWEAENLYRLYTRVAPSFIRVDADEVTYPAHILLRTKLERAMIAGDLAVGDLPGAWRDEMRRLLGIVPETDREGCLQDVHWPGGDFGYFPTYTLGAMTAAQLFDAAKRQLPELLSALAKGDFAPLLGWLRTNVHRKGALLDAEALLQETTGQPLQPAIYQRHLVDRYLA